jgi:hypothetical protein
LAEFNKTVLLICFGALLFLWLSVTVPGLQIAFSISFPGYYHLLPALIGAVALLIILEITKLIRMHRKTETTIN